MAVIKFSPPKRKSRLKGLIPVGWFPGAIAFDAARGGLCVANIKGHARRARPSPSRTGAPGFNSHQYHGSLSIVREPRQKELWEMTDVVYANYHRERIAEALLQPRPGQPARPVPERIGEPSVFKHVVYVIKENRTYDQVLGDVAEGNGDPALCIFGEQVTPNQHKLVRDFVLLDNTYCSGILSADGHQWSTTAFGTDYLERSFAGWPRSYPDGMGPDEIDALAYAPSGFIWDNALKHGVSLWNFGEFTMPDCGWADPARKGEPQWADYWDEYRHGRGLVRIGSVPAIETVAPFSPTDTAGLEHGRPRPMAGPLHRRPDRAVGEGGPDARAHPHLPARTTTPAARARARRRPRPASPTTTWPSAASSRPSAGAPSGRRPSSSASRTTPRTAGTTSAATGPRPTAPALTPSAAPSSRTQYNTVSILRTIEQILGLPPMNQFDAAADADVRLLHGRRRTSRPSTPCPTASPWTR